jgi:hypothetical protein
MWKEGFGLGCDGFFMLGEVMWEHGCKTYPHRRDVYWDLVGRVEAMVQSRAMNGMF